MKKTITPAKLCPHFQDYLVEDIKNYQQIEVLSIESSQNVEQWDIFDAYSSQKIINLVEQTKRDQNFLPILAFNMQKKSNYFKIKRIMRPSTLFTLQQLITQLKNAKQEQKAEMFCWIVSIINEYRNIIQKNQEMVNQFQSQCLQYCIYEVKKQLKIAVGFRSIKLSKIQQLHTAVQSLLTRLEATIKQIGTYVKYQPQKIDELKNLDKNMIQLIFKMKVSIQNQVEKQSTSNALCLNQKQMLYQEIMSNFTSHIFDMIDSTIIDLTEAILNEHLQANNNFNTSFISSYNPTTKKSFKGQIYHNINCSHFEGLSYQDYSTLKQCSICGQKIVFDAERAKQVGRNIFHMVLLHNSVNPKSNNVVYYFKQKVFTIKKSILQDYLDAYSNYFHYQNYVKRTKNLHDRTQIINYHKYESINLYNKIKGTKKFYSSIQLIKTPVRGRYCHHWQFYDLKRVYSILKKNKSQVFNCFVCLQQVNAEQIIYLQEMSHLITLSKQYFPSIHLKEQYRYSINIDHQQRTIILSFKQNNSRQLLLPVQLYQTVEDPLSKSRYVRDQWQQEDQQIQLSVEFRTFFFGK